MYEERRNHFCGLLQGELKGVVSFGIPEGGMSVWTIFDPAVNLTLLAEKLSKKG
ncbi:hypothetical protein [Chitinophaga pinensis]|uniref:hypothetical protein n=1 Tax=Chitinophaga pinensis TaxID=79329 RepID=UPI001C997B73|nr:hypothetical protein [Chitinophaga pinensis]